MSGRNKLRQIGIQLVVRKARQGDIAGGAVVPLCQRDPTGLGRGDGIVTERLVKVAQTEQQNHIGMLLLDRAVLPHQWGLGRSFHGAKVRTGRQLGGCLI